MFKVGRLLFGGCDMAPWLDDCSPLLEVFNGKGKVSSTFQKFGSTQVHNKVLLKQTPVNNYDTKSTLASFHVPGAKFLFIKVVNMIFVYASLNNGVFYVNK